MSSSNSNPKGIQFDYNKSQQPEFSPGSSSTVPSSRETTSLGGVSATAGEGDDDEDGFRTPTGSGQRIPETRICPPAPRKPTARALKMRPTKRRASTEEVTWINRDRRIQVLVDLSDEIESLFPPVVRADFACKIKKARTV